MTKQTVSKNSHTASAAVRNRTNMHESATAGMQRATSNHAMQRMLRTGAVQAKLTVNTPGDKYEQEADRVADQVMRMTSAAAGDPPHIQRACTSCSRELKSQTLQRTCASCSAELKSEKIQRMCTECEEEKVQRKERGGAPDLSADVESQVLALRGSGEQLPARVREFFEPRFGQDFSNVRVHTSGTAAQSAKSVNALAYTMRNDIVFATGQYSPHTTAGRRLIAHELTHTVQQGAGHNHTIQRACTSGVPSTPGCTPDPTITPPSDKFLFNVNCDDFAPGQEALMDSFASTRISATSTVRIVGLASSDGPAELNDRLSCSRAQKGLAVVRRSAPSAVTISSVVATGGIPATTSDPTMRAVGLEVSTPRPRRRPPPRPPIVKPGPRTPCERDCEFDFERCLNLSDSPLECLARQGTCMRGCAGAPSAFEVCVRLLQPPVEVSGCNHAYVETPTRRYAIITPCTGRLSFADPVSGGVALKTDRSPDPCRRRPTCIECIPRPGITDLETCFESQFRAYAAPSLHKLLGPNSNTFAGTLARACCANMAVKPAAFGCLPGWDDPPAPSRTAPCPSGPPVC